MSRKPLSEDAYLDAMLRRSATRPLTPQASDMLEIETAQPLPDLPWVLQLRIVGTPDILNVRISDKPLIVGRQATPDQPKPDIDLNPFGGFEKGVSRQHARIRAEDNIITLTDLKSSNGTYISNKKLHPGLNYPLNQGDQVRLGQLQLTVQFHVVPRDTTRSLRPPPQETKPLTSKNNRHILVVEDDMDVAYAYRVLFEKEGYKVSVTDDPAEVMMFLKQVKPDAVISDIFLEGHMPLDIVHLIRQELPKTIPLMVISGMTGGHLRQKCLKNGADVFLGKPVHLDEVLLQVEKLITERAS
jgi:CheY-like chemotaxis protein